MNAFSQFGELLNHHLEEAKVSGEQFNEELKKTQAEYNKIYGQIADHLLNKKVGAKEVSPEIQEIVNILSAQPRLINATKVFLKRIVSRINESVESILSDYDEKNAAAK